MRTILITCFHPFVSRNILQTALIDLLAASSERRVVVLVPEYKKSYIQELVSGRRVIVEGVVANQPTKSFRGLLFKRLSAYMLGTETIRFRRHYKLFVEKKLAYFFFFLLPARLLGKFRLGVRVVRFLDYRLAPTEPFDSLCDAFCPALVFATDIQNENDVALAQAARKRRIPVIGMVRSWDNLTAQYLLRLLPQKLLVSGEALKADAVRNGMSEEDVAVVGVPHYDRYVAGRRCRARHFSGKSAPIPGSRWCSMLPSGICT